MSATARPVFAKLILLFGVTIACNFGVNAGDDQLVTGEPAEASTQAPAPAEPTQAPAATATAAPPTAPPTTPVATNVGEDSAPTFAEGAWTGGEAEVRVTGSDTRTITGSLIPGSGVTVSASYNGLTTLFYAAGLDTISISIPTEYQSSFAVLASQENFGVSPSNDQPQCEVTYQEASDTRIAGTFRCEHAEIIVGPALGPAVMEGSFTATR